MCPWRSRQSSYRTHKNSAGEGAVPAATGETATEPVDVLDKAKCLHALAELRHAKWFQARCSGHPSCLIVLRVMRDVCQRIPTWAPLKQWALELLVEKVLTSACAPLQPADGMRRVFEAIAAGVLLRTGHGVLDPCEKDGQDAIADLTDQQREDISSSAQHALRLCAFNQLYKILGIERLSVDTMHNNPRKRTHPEDDADAASGEKKERKEPTATTA